MDSIKAPAGRPLFLSVPPPPLFVMGLRYTTTQTVTIIKTEEDQNIQRIGSWGRFGRFGLLPNQIRAVQLLMDDTTSRVLAYYGATVSRLYRSVDQSPRPTFINIFTNRPTVDQLSPVQGSIIPLFRKRPAQQRVTPWVEPIPHVYDQPLNPHSLQGTPCSHLSSRLDAPAPLTSLDLEVQSPMSSFTDYLQLDPARALVSSMRKANLLHLTCQPRASSSIPSGVELFPLGEQKRHGPPKRSRF